MALPPLPPYAPLSWWTLPYFKIPYRVPGYPFAAKDMWTYRGQGKPQGYGWLANVMSTQMYGHFSNVTLKRGYHKDPSIDSQYPSPIPPKPGPPCPCAVLKLADATWLDLTPEQKAAWNNAVKKPHMSGYQLWMKEAMLCIFAFGVFPNPDAPSPSGGYSGIDLNPDYSNPVPENTIGAAPPTAPPPPPPPFQTCFKCIPPLPTILYATCTGFAGDFAVFNNPDGPRWLLTWIRPCYWTLRPLPDAPPTSSLNFWYGTTAENWFATLTIRYRCRMVLIRDTEARPCDADGEPFHFYNCSRLGCDDDRSCIDSQPTGLFMLYSTP